MTRSLSTWKSPPQVGEQLTVGPAKVLGWIKSGELRAVNVAATTTGRPRWRIPPDALAEFIARRSATPAAPTPRRRTKRPANIKSYV